jgi:Zinc dependent phospholipase C
MAGPYAHCMISRKALKLFNSPIYGGYSNLMSDELLPYIYLGSISPDYPYPAYMLTNVDPILDNVKGLGKLSWGDKLHKQNTGDFMRSGVAKLREYCKPGNKEGQKDKPVLTAWLLGYYSHIITDAIVHAVVYNIVGKYEDNKTEHRKCEMVEDSLIFKRELNKELPGNDFLSVLERCQTLSAFDISDPMKPSEYMLKEPVKGFWDGILREVFTTYHRKETPDIDAWHRQYIRVNSIAVGNFGRAIGSVAEAVSYDKTDDISNADRLKYYTDLRLPGRTTAGDYKIDVFDYAVEQVMAGWANVLDALADYKAFKKLDSKLKNIDLDTGTVDGIKYVFWPEGKTSDWRA